MAISLAEARRRANMTQQMLADKLGVSRQAVSNWELGKNLPSIIVGKQIADLLGVSLHDIDFKKNGRSRS